MTDDHSAAGGAPEQTTMLTLFTEHPGVWLPGLYVLGSTVGMLDSWWFFHQFGINIFLYSNIADFLLASFREPAAWLITGWSIAFALLDHRNSVRVGRSTTTRRWLRWYGARRYRRISWLLAILLVAAYIVTFAGMRADDIYEARRGQAVRIVLANDAGTTVAATLLGSTIGFLFLYDADRQAVAIHPYQNVLTVESALPERARR